MKANGMLSRAVCTLAFSVFWAALACPAGTGRVYVTSAPRGARVYLDEDAEPRGKTPCLLRGIPVGTHTVRASLQGYVDVTQEFEVSEDAMPKVTLTFTTKKSDEEGGAGAAPAEADQAPEAAGDERAGSEGSPSGEDKPPKYVEVDCPACKGTGLVQEMGCPKCSGTGYVGLTRCAACGGDGRIEHRCSACKGTGTIVLGGKERICARCRGKGRLQCLVCRGTGKIKRLNPEISRKPTMTCPLCGGSGFECKAKCLRCSGKGTMVVGTASTTPGGRTDFDTEVVDCPFCEDGVGIPVCRKCRGAGVVNVHKDPTPCPACSGTGHEFRPCRGCGGRGWIVPK